MSDLTLPRRLLARIGQISQRSDVIVHQQSRSRGGSRIGRWQDKLPADMFAFYQAINGLKFHYAFADAPDGWHGLELLALDEDGRKVIDTFRNRYRVSRQAARRYPEHFFQAGEVSPDTPVLFFFGSDDAWGVIMQGEGESASFHHWDNDGFVKHLAGSFTDVIERLLERGFAHTWAYSDSHPDTDEVMRRLAIEVPLRTTCQVTVESVVQRSASDHRKGILAPFPDEVHAKVIRALGLSKEAKGLAREERIALIEVACSSLAPIPEKVAVSVMKALGYYRPSREEFSAFFRCDAGPVAIATLLLEPASGPASQLARPDVLSRVLHSIDGFHVTDGCHLPSEVIRFMDLHSHSLSWSPFIGCSFDGSGGDEDKLVRCVIVLDAPRARGMEAGKSHPSSALLGVEGRIG